MPILPEEFNFLEEVVAQAEDLVRDENPEFTSGFCVITTHAHRVESTMLRLQGVKENLKKAEDVLLEKIAELCNSVPQYTPKGISHSRRLLRDRSLFKKLVAAQSQKRSEDDDDTEEDSPIAQSLKDMSFKDAKVEFERHDQRLRFKQQGIQKLSVLIGRYMGMLRPRINRLRNLEEVGKRWNLRIFEASDIELVGRAQKIVTDSSVEIKTINRVLDLFPADFTKVLEVEDVGSRRGLKRKALLEVEIETLKTMKKNKICTKEI